MKYHVERITNGRHPCIIHCGIKKKSPNIQKRTDNDGRGKNKTWYKKRQNGDRYSAQFQTMSRSLYFVKISSNINTAKWREQQKPNKNKKDIQFLCIFLLYFERSTHVSNAYKSSSSNANCSSSCSRLCSVFPFALFPCLAPNKSTSSSAIGLRNDRSSLFILLLLS